MVACPQGESETSSRESWETTALAFCTPTSVATAQQVVARALPADLEALELSGHLASGKLLRRLYSLQTGEFADEPAVQLRVLEMMPRALWGGLGAELAISVEQEVALRKSADIVCQFECVLGFGRAAARLIAGMVGSNVSLREAPEAWAAAIRLQAQAMSAFVSGCEEAVAGLCWPLLAETPLLLRAAKREVERLAREGSREAIRIVATEVLAAKPVGDDASVY
jgi:hypothetical protein